ncbi:ABC transporter permease [bacterium]|nr:ABC transporter permease [bacterium]
MAPNIRYAAEGDFEQIFAEMAETDGLAAARRWFWFEAIKSIPHFIIDTIVWSFVMLKNYLRVAYRNLLKNKASSLVNVLGLAIAVATATTAYVFIEYQNTMDHFHENADQIYLVETRVDRGSSVELRGDAPAPLGPEMLDTFPQVERAVRVVDKVSTVQAGENTFREGIRFVDPDFLQMFSFKLRLGDPTRVLGFGDVVISDEMAQKYFGESNPMGQELTVILNEQTTSVFTVTGVAAPFPTKTSFGFNALLHIDQAQSVGFLPNDWAINATATFIQVATPAELALVAGQMDAFRLRQNEAREDNHIEKFEFGSLKTLSKNAYYVAAYISSGSHPASIVVMGVISVFMLLLACINYMNLAIATASRRLKEIGVRKAIGSSRSQLVAQFLAENVLTCLIAMIAGVALAHFVFLPGFNNFSNGLAISLETADITWLLVFLGATLIGTGLLSGAYPAFYISSFRPTAIFRGNAKIGGESWLTRGLLTFQFTLAFLTMIMGVALAQNANYQASKEWGYDSDHLLVLQTETGQEFGLLQDSVAPLAGVESVVGSVNHVARSWDDPTVHLGDKSIETARFDVGASYLDVMDIPLVSGNPFTEASNSLVDGAVLINREFAEAMDVTPEEAVGKSFRQDSTTYAVAGVVESFMYDAFYNQIEPAFFRVVPESEFRFLSIKIAAGSVNQTEEAVRAAWKELFPTKEYTGRFQDQAFQAIYVENTNVKTMFLFISLLALIIACMGLFGMAAQKVASRTKEIGIRKVMGASVVQIAGLMNRSFLIILVVAGVIAAPLGYVAIGGLLNSIYADPLAMGPSAFLVSFAFVVTTAVLTISTQIRKLKRTNPTDLLRYE